MDLGFIKALFFAHSITRESFFKHQFDERDIDRK